MQRGQSFFITRHGKRIAELGPVRHRTKRPGPGFASGTFTDVAPDFDAPLEDFASMGNEAPARHPRTNLVR
ncbi:MAG: type II toxin-antitoxin system Phd/YefM family antitoxin [Verrucomicrobiia bacterium]